MLTLSQAGRTAFDAGRDIMGWLEAFQVLKPVRWSFPG
jgi:hypothetical protein